MKAARVVVVERDASRQLRESRVLAGVVVAAELEAHDASVSLPTRSQQSCRIGPLPEPRLPLSVAC
jgi:hypothetical protein